MIYYRLAVQEHETLKWIWKSTAVTSLVAVLHLLRMYSPIPPERMRVFSATCVEELAEMLNRENDGLTSGSLTAGDFLRERRLVIREVATREMLEQQVQRSLAVAVDAPMRNDDHVSNNAGVGSVNMLDQKRMHIESGAGGDHDMPYQFALPLPTPQLLAWTRLMSKVQAGEMQP